MHTLKVSTRRPVDARLRFAMCLALASVICSDAAHGESTTQPYETLRAGYAARDAQLAARSYSEDAAYAELYTGTAPVVHVGRPAIAQAFDRLFAALAPSPGDPPLDLNFRRTSRAPLAGGSVDSGYFRLRLGRTNNSAARTWYGSFAVRIHGNEFTVDTGRDATVDEFELAPGGLLFAAEDEELDGAFYDKLTGTYRRGADRCQLIVTRSSRRLFAYDECTAAWRGLRRDSGLVWRGGVTVISDAPTHVFEFQRNEAGAITALAITDQLGQAQQFVRHDDFQRRTAVIATAHGKLGATLYAPSSPSQSSAPAYVLVHGSGPQDRNGYASYVALLATQLARHGAIALTYDKRGTGDSTGDWSVAGFPDLAADVRAALEFLRTVPGVDPQQVGIVGSSQAGWVAAKAIADGATPHRVVLIGAAGAAITVEQQNLYNTRVRMECAGLRRSDVELALAQQRSFFAARRDRRYESELAQLSRDALARPTLRDWLFPATVAPSASPEWYDVLDPAFDPLEVWRSFRGSTYFLLSANDDSTPTALVARKLATLPKLGARNVKILDNAQHLGLVAANACAGDLDRASTFHPDFFPQLIRAIR